MTTPTLQQLGLRPFFQQQLSLEELEQFQLARIIEQHRSEVVAMCEQGEVHLTYASTYTTNGERVCVGDWVLFDQHNRLHRPLERQSLFQRKASGSKIETQLIAANIDTAFIVCSLNDDFNLNRIERYLAVTREAQTESVIVLTKADLADEVDEKVAQVQKLDPLLLVHAVNVLDDESVSVLRDYCRVGKTICLLGSSGVGKSTIVNALKGEQVMETGGIREQDSKGRHTTTFRSIQALPDGGLIMDSPGMRELQLTDCETGLKETFSDIEALAQQCRFSDCQHNGEPGCAIKTALENGDIDERRFNNYQKLLKEQAHNSASLAEKRAKDKDFTKLIKGVKSKPEYKDKHG